MLSTTISRLKGTRITSYNVCYTKLLRGSIGGELARRIVRYAPDELILVDRAENALHDLMEELSHLPDAHRIRGALVDT